jgi:hypothetical protein
MMKGAKLYLQKSSGMEPWTNKNELEQNQHHKGEEFHQELYHPIIFMKMFKERTRIISAVNDQRR